MDTRHNEDDVEWEPRGSKQGRRYESMRAGRRRAKMMGSSNLPGLPEKRRRVGLNAEKPWKKQDRGAASTGRSDQLPPGTKATASVARGGAAGGSGRKVTWVGAPRAIKRGRKHYDAFVTAGGLISLHNFVYIAQEEDEGLDRYMGHVIDLYEDPGGGRFALVQWLYLPREISPPLEPEELLYGAREVFYTEQTQLLNVECVDGVCTVVTPQAFKVALCPDVDEDVHVCGRMYDVRSKVFQRYDVSYMPGYSKQPWLRRLALEGIVVDAPDAPSDDVGSSSDSDASSTDDDDSDSECEGGGEDGIRAKRVCPAGARRLAPPSGSEGGSGNISVEAPRTPQDRSPSAARGLGAGGPGRGFPLECDRACCVQGKGRFKRWCRLVQPGGSSGCGHAAHPRRNWCYPIREGHVAVFPGQHEASAPSSTSSPVLSPRVARPGALTPDSSHGNHEGGEGGAVRLSARVQERRGIPLSRRYARWEAVSDDEEYGRPRAAREAPRYPPGTFGLSKECTMCGQGLRKSPIWCATPGCLHRAHKKCVGMDLDGRVLPYNCGDCALGRGGGVGGGGEAGRAERGRQATDNSTLNDGPCSSADVSPFVAGAAGRIRAEAEGEDGSDDDVGGEGRGGRRWGAATEMAFAALEAELGTIRPPVVMRNGIRMRLPAKSSTKFGLLCVLCKDPLKRDPARCVGPGCRDRAHKKCVRAAAAYKRGQIDPAGNDCFSKFLCPCCDGSPTNGNHDDGCAPELAPEWNGDVNTLDREQMAAIDMDMECDECPYFSASPGEAGGGGGGDDDGGGDFRLFGDLDGLLEDGEGEEELAGGSMAHMCSWLADAAPSEGVALAAAAAAAAARAGGEAAGGENDEPEASEVSQASTVSSDGRSQEMLMAEEGDDADSGARGGIEDRAAEVEEATAGGGEPPEEAVPPPAPPAPEAAGAGPVAGEAARGSGSGAEEVATWSPPRDAEAPEAAAAAVL